MPPAVATPSSPSVPRPPIGILISTYNRAASLLECLRHLEAQTWKDFEVAIVVDGSTDSTLSDLEAYKLSAPFPIRYLAQANAGAARARNAGIPLLNAPICLLLGDDIFATPDLVRLHLEFHRTHPGLSAVALGLTRWSEQGQIVTPFMRWLESDGVQFAYAELLRGAPPDWKHFYTSNLSLKTAYLAANPFREDFAAYGIEDIELGYRLSQQQTLAMHFLPDAIACHLHPTTFPQSCRRAEHIGHATFLFGQLWPQQRLTAPRTARMRLLLRLAARFPFLLGMLRGAASLVTRIHCPNPLMKIVLWLHLRLGYRLAEEAATEGETR